MTAHAVNKNYDSAGHPATLSPHMIPTLLRKKGYEGVVIPDDMHMGAIQNNYSLSESVQLAFNATCDILMLSNNPGLAKNVPNFKPNPRISLDVIEIIKENIDQGKISLERINEAYGRVKALKDKL